mmetsp:Transcript_83718/g.260098  ORF Transcript_83718/g.260098 Transcript_83718/m.260098 type:complete len:456 (+) Transcript_83718:77-1444(+)
MQNEEASAARGEQMREFADDARKQAEAWRNQMPRNALLDIEAAVRDANRREEQARKGEDDREKKAIENIQRLQSIGDKANYTERWRLLGETLRVARELRRQKVLQSDFSTISDEIRKLRDDEVARTTAERERKARWQDLVARLLRVTRKAGDEVMVAEKGEESREEQEARRGKETDQALKKLQAGEDQVRGDEAAFEQSERERAQGENRRISELQEAIGRLTEGEHWLKGLEVSRWHHEMKREEQERWRQEQEKLHAIYLSKLTGNTTHDEKVRRWYEAQRVKNERKRQIRMKYLRGEALTEEEAAINDEAAREHAAQDRVDLDGRLFHEAEMEDTGIGREFTRLERMELARRRAEKGRIQAEYRREDAEERRVKEIVTTVLKHARRGPPGPRGPTRPAEENDVDRYCPGHPYCPRRRRSHWPTMAAALAVSPEAVAARLAQAMPPVAGSPMQRG